MLARPHGALREIMSEKSRQSLLKCCYRVATLGLFEKRL